MNVWDDPKFSQPTDAVGDWHDVRSALFEHAHRPAAMRYTLEKLTAQLLQLETMDAGTRVLRYSGTSGAGGHPCTVGLELCAARAGREPMHLYRLTVECVAPRRWEDERRFIAEGERRFAHWCRQLRLIRCAQAWAAHPCVPLAGIINEAIAAEAAAMRAVEDPRPVAAVQRRVLDALRDGCSFFTAGKEGGSHLFHDGHVFRRNDYGEAPNRQEVHADDVAMLACLRNFYDWDAQRDSYPHRKPELDIWNYIFGQLRRP